MRSDHLRVSLPGAEKASHSIIHSIIHSIAARARRVPAVAGAILARKTSGQLLVDARRAAMP